jgi:DNA polymerase-1
MSYHILIDADIVAFRACAACEEHVAVGEFDYKRADSARVQYKIIEDVQHILERTKADKVTMAFTSETNFRTPLMDSYKGHRDPKSRPLGLKAAREWMGSYYTSLKFPDLEADDILGIMEPAFDLLVSGDKDLLTIPGKHFNPQQDEGRGRFHTIDEATANTNWLVQTVQGDTADGYKGCPGLGEVRTRRLLEPLSGDLKAQWAAVVAAFEKAEQTEEDAIRQARMARILRNGEWSLEGGVKLWSPEMI